MGALRTEPSGAAHAAEGLGPAQTLRSSPGRRNPPPPVCNNLSMGQTTQHAGNTASSAAEIAAGENLDLFASTLERPHGIAPEQHGQVTHAQRADLRGNAIAVGTRIGRYLVLRQLGQGGMGAVYSAYDGELDRKVAIKILHGAQEGGPDSRLRILREAQAMARISHPNVVSVYEVGEFQGQVYIAMEFIDGTTLTEWQRQPRTWSETLAVYCAAGGGLQAAHQAGLIHRANSAPKNRRRIDRLRIARTG